MFGYKKRKRMNRIIAGFVSAAMTFTMVPDVWLPVHALDVREDILGADVSSEYSESSDDNLFTESDVYTESVSRSIYAPALESSEKLFEYSVFSANRSEDFTLNGWKAYFTGGYIREEILYAIFRSSILTEKQTQSEL